ncbi:MAG: hypothetical protein LBE35_01385 [Clostridiales bacterium]|jgi:hypothetical protein|nr:hypothetical protein [Clostridiales bacterium]
MKEATFTFRFRGERAEEVAEAFFAHYYDGGLDQSIEQNFLENFGLTLDDTEFDKAGTIINT